MPPKRIVEPVRVHGNLTINLPTETPAHLIQAIYQVNLSGEEILLRLPNGLQAVLTPGSDLDSLSRLVESDEFDEALESLREEPEKR